MSRFRASFFGVFAIAAALSSGFVQAEDALEKPKAFKGVKNRELHLVGIYEGYAETGTQRDIGRAIVNVNRPGKSVVLVLGSSQWVTWTVDLHSETKLERVILCGNHTQSVDGVPKGIPVDNRFRGGDTTWKSSFDIGQNRNSPVLRAAMMKLREATGLEPSSFQGSYRAKREAPFKVDKVENDPRLSADYPKAEVPEELSRLTFSAVYYARDEASLGEFTPAGPKKETLKPLPRRIIYAATGAGGKVFGVDMHGSYTIDLKRREATKLDPGQDISNLGWTNGIMFDKKRGRMLITSFSGEDYLFAHDPAAGTWKVVSTLNNLGVMGMCHHEQSDTLYGLVAPRSDDNSAYPILYSFNAEGAVIAKRTLGDPFVPGIVTHHLIDNYTQVIPLERHLVILVSPARFGRSEREDSTSWIFVYDIAKETLRLTHRRDEPREP